jgi:putative membrane protein
MLHTSALGALLTFAPSAWYPLDGAPAFGLTALEDQQLGGLVMWLPGGLAYMIAGLAVVRRWLSAPRVARLEHAQPQ